MRKNLDPRYTDEKNIHEKKYSQQKISYPRNTHEKTFGPTNDRREKISNPRNTHKKAFWTLEIYTRKSFGRTSEGTMAR